MTPAARGGGSISLVHVRGQDFKAAAGNTSSCFLFGRKVEVERP